MRLWRRYVIPSVFGLTISVFWVSSLSAVVVPRLNSVLVRINGEEKEVRRDETLEIIRGDQLTLLFAKLDGSNNGPDIINLIGYRRQDFKTRLGDDRDLLIDTNQLIKKWSIDKKGQFYRIEAKSGPNVHGSIRLSVFQPKLIKLELLVNNELRTLGPGDSLHVKVSDAIQVKAIHTNSPRLDELARAVFQDVSGSREAKVGSTQVDIQLWYRDYRFAQLPLTVGAD